MGAGTGGAAAVKLIFEQAQERDADIIFGQAQQLIGQYEDPQAVDIPKVEEWMRKKISSQIGTYQKIVLEGECVGYFRLEEQGNRTELDDLYILPSYRGRGIGTQVMHYCLDNARKPIYFYVFHENHGAIRFYQHFGFQITQRVSATRSIMSQMVDR